MSTLARSVFTSAHSHAAERHQQEFAEGDLIALMICRHADGYLLLRHVQPQRLMQSIPNGQPLE